MESKGVYTSSANATLRPVPSNIFEDRLNRLGARKYKSLLNVRLDKVSFLTNHVLILLLLLSSKIHVVRNIMSCHPLPKSSLV